MRWGIRIAGILMVLMFLFLFTMMYRQLVQLQRMRQPAATQTSITPAGPALLRCPQWLESS